MRMYLIATAGLLLLTACSSEEDVDQEHRDRFRAWWAQLSNQEQIDECSYIETFGVLERYKTYRGEMSIGLYGDLYDEACP